MVLNTILDGIPSTTNLCAGLDELFAELGLTNPGTRVLPLGLLVFPGARVRPYNQRLFRDNAL